MVAGALGSAALRMRSSLGKSAGLSGIAFSTTGRQSFSIWANKSSWLLPDLPEARARSRRRKAASRMAIFGWLPV